MTSRSVRLPVILLLLYLAPGMAAPEWIVDASAPGPNRPQAGESRFDQLFRQSDGSYRIPYPFDNLIEFLESRLDNGADPAVRRVFVPIGRSLQRETPAPEYFRYPRQVIATEGEPATAGNEPGKVMEYRLFVAHQPRSETLEVVSYNDSAGRFEFQVIEAYDANRAPRARPTSRVMCMSCHHNAAPIFARNPWSETSFNVEVARRLAAALPERFDSMIEVVTLDAGVIDVLAERANYLAAAQHIWRHGCASTECRAAMLRAVLQYRLSGKSNFDRNDPRYRRDYFDQLVRNWEDRWPRGLALPGSRIPDRDPFADTPRQALHDPLLPRPPHATWYGVDAALAAGIVFRLGGYFTLADIRRLDRRLAALGDADSAPTVRYRADCRAVSREAARLRLECGVENSPQSLQATLDIEIRRQRIAELRVVSLNVPRDPNILQPAIRSLSVAKQELLAEFGDSQSALSQRLATGDRVKSMTLGWQDSPGDLASWLDIEVSTEFRFLDAALGRMLASQRQGGSLEERVFSRESLLRDLMRELGMVSLDWDQAPRTRSRPQSRPVARLGGGLALLEPYCAHCHAGEGSNPPGFLSANAPRAALARCAPRMLARLRAWQPRQALDRSPMPPPASIAYSGMSAGRWTSSGHYRSLVEGLENLLEKEYGARAASDWQRADYGTLPSCIGAFSE